MYDQILQGLKPFIRSGAITDIREATKIGPKALVVRAAGATSIVNVTEDGIEVVHGDNKAAVLSGITPSQAVLFIVQSLGRADFDIPDTITVRFQAEDYPQKVTSAVLAPVGITKSQYDGTFQAVYKDAQGRYYIHEDECRVSLKLYKELYDRNNEAQMLTLPKLFQSEQPPVLSANFTMVSESMASQIVLESRLASFREAAEKGLPVRLTSAVIPETGVLRVGGEEYAVEGLYKDMVKLTSAWEGALTGKIPEPPKPADFSSVELSLGKVAVSSGRAEAVFEFASPWAGGDLRRDGVFVDRRVVVMSKEDLSALLDKFDSHAGHVVSSKPEVIASCLTLAKDVKPVTSAAVKPVKAQVVSSLSTASASKAEGASFLVSAVTPKGAKEMSRETFVKEAGIPSWMSSCTIFSSVRLG